MPAKQKQTPLYLQSREDFFPLYLPSVVIKNLSGKDKLLPCWDPEAEVIRIPKRWGIMVKETRFVQESAPAEDATMRLIQLGADIESNLNVDPSVVGEFLIKPSSHPELYRYLPRWQASQREGPDKDIWMVTSILKHRVAEDWTFEDTLDLPTQIFQSLSRFIEEENRSYTPPKPQAVDPSENEPAGS